MSNEEAKLFVAGLPETVSEDVLRQLFEATGGTVVSVSLPKDRTTGRPRGFGFVTLATPEEAQSAREALDGSIQAGKSISVRPFQSEPPRRDGVAGAPPSSFGPRGPSSVRGPSSQANAPDRTLYVGNLPYDCTTEEVEELINGAVEGGVVRVYFPVDQDGRKRGFGFVTMATAEGAKTVSEQLRSAELRGRRLVINLKGDRPPPRNESRGFGGGGGGFGGGGGGYGGGGGPPSGGGFGGGPGNAFPPPPGSFGPPARKAHDDRKRKFSEDGGAPKKNRRPEREERLAKSDYDDDE